MPLLRKPASDAGSDLDSRLKMMQQRWNEGKEQAKTFADKLPEGEYIGKLVNCRLDLTKSTSKMAIFRVHAPTEGDYKGKNVYDMISIETDQGLAFVALWLDSIGVALPDKVEELKELVKKIDKEGYSCKFSCRHDNDFTNVRILEMAGAEGASEGGDGAQVDLEKLDRAGLEALIKEYQLDVAISAKMTEAQIRKAITDAVNAGSTEPAAGDDAANELLQKTTAFCEANGIDIAGESDLEKIAAAIQGYDFKEEELTDEEKALLNELGIYDAVVVKPKPAVKAKASPKLKK